MSVSLLGLRRGHKVSVLLANTPAQGGADTRMYVMDGCCCFAHAAAETMLLTRHRSCHISNWPLFRPRPASRGRTNTNLTLKQCADRFDQCSEQMSARKDVPRMFDSIGANTHESKLRLFSRPPLPHSFAQALLRAQEATSSHFERNLARFGLTHVQQCGLALRIHTQDPRQTHQ